MTHILVSLCMLPTSSSRFSSMRRRIHVGLVGHTHTCVVMHVTYSKVKYEEEEDTCVTGDTYTGIVACYLQYGYAR